MWPQCGPLPPKPEAGMAIGRRTGRPSPVRLGTIAMLASTSSTTDASTAHGRRAPSARERREGGPASPGRPRAQPAPRSRLPLPRSMCLIKETRRGKATVRARKAAALEPCLPRQSPRHQRRGNSNQPPTKPPCGGASVPAKKPAAGGTHQSAGPNGRRRSRRA